MTINFSTDWISGIDGQDHKPRYEYEIRNRKFLGSCLLMVVVFEPGAFRTTCKQ
jgi:hypothetical protein